MVWLWIEKGQGRNSGEEGIDRLWREFAWEMLRSGCNHKLGKREMTTASRPTEWDVLYPHEL